MRPALAARSLTLPYETGPEQLRSPWTMMGSVIEADSSSPLRRQIWLEAIRRPEDTRYTVYWLELVAQQPKREVLETQFTYDDVLDFFDDMFHQLLRKGYRRRSSGEVRGHKGGPKCKLTSTPWHLKEGTDLLQMRPRPA